MADAVRGIALVTGTSSGIGASVTERLLDRGWTVVGVARRAAALTNSRYIHLAVDLQDPASLPEIEQRMSAKLDERRWERVGLVNNAARVGNLGPVERIDPDELMKLYALNVVTPVWCMGLMSRRCPPDVPLRIVNVSSGAAVQAIPGLADYGSAKAALRMAGMVLAAEWKTPVPHAPGRTDGAILSYEPGLVDTAMQKQARTTPSDEFPWVEMFQNFERHKLLVPAGAPAAEIVEFLESRNQPTFAERRLAIDGG